MRDYYSIMGLLFLRIRDIIIYYKKKKIFTIIQIPNKTNVTINGIESNISTRKTYCTHSNVLVKVAYMSCAGCLISARQGTRVGVTTILL